MSLVDNKPVMEAANLLKRGKFSASKIMNEALISISDLNLEYYHNSGKLGKNYPDDLASRQPSICNDPTRCRVHKFIQDCTSIIGAVKVTDGDIIGYIQPEFSQTLLQDILAGRMRLPLENKKAMIYLQGRDRDLQRVRSLLQAGQFPSHKRDLPGVKVFFRAGVNTSIDEEGCIVVTKTDRKDFSKRKLVVVPNNLSEGLIYSLHLNLNHPTASQLAQILDTRFYIQDCPNKCKYITEACAPCMAMKTIPAEVQHFKSNEVPDHPGLAFTVDVIKTNKQLILASVDNFSGLVAATFIKSERMEDLRDGIVTTVTPYMASSLGRVRVDPAPGFIKLTTSCQLSDMGIDIEIGNTKNKNKVALIDTKIKELRRAILKAAPAHNVINVRVLAKACTALNESVRHHGLSAKEVHFSRDRVTNENLHMKDQDMADKIQDHRDKTNTSRAKTQEKSRPAPKPANAAPGNVVFLKDEGDKTKPRDLYLVMETDTATETMTICKLRDALSGKMTSIEPQRYRYHVHQNDAYLAPNQPEVKVHHDIHDVREEAFHDVHLGPPPCQRPPRIAKTKRHSYAETDSDWSDTDDEDEEEVVDRDGEEEAEDLDEEDEEGEGQGGGEGRIEGGAAEQDGEDEEEEAWLDAQEGELGEQTPEEEEEDAETPEGEADTEEEKDAEAPEGGVDMVEVDAEAPEREGDTDTEGEEGDAGVPEGEGGDTGEEEEGGSEEEDAEGEGEDSIGDDDGPTLAEVLDQEGAPVKGDIISYHSREKRKWIRVLITMARTGTKHYYNCRRLDRNLEEGVFLKPAHATDSGYQEAWRFEERVRERERLRSGEADPPSRDHSPLPHVPREELQYRGHTSPLQQVFHHPLEDLEWHQPLVEGQVYRLPYLGQERLPGRDGVEEEVPREEGREEEGLEGAQAQPRKHRRFKDIFKRK